MSELSTAELYAIQLNENDPKYYAQVPSAVFHCTYLVMHDDGTLERKKLSANAIALYTLIKSIAGQESACWVNRDNLAEMLGRSAGSITTAKQELQRPMEQLNGKSLIQVTKKKRRRAKDKGGGGTTYDLIVPTHVWPENNAFMAVRTQLKPLPLGIVDSSGSPSIIDGEESSPSIIDTEVRGSPSIIDTNKNPSQKKKNSVTEQERAADAAPVCNSPPDPSVISVIEDAEMQRETAAAQMRAFGCDEPFVREMLKKYSPKRIRAAGVYTQMQRKRRPLRNPLGYLRNAIEQGREWKE